MTGGSAARQPARGHPMRHDPGPRDPHFADEALALHVAVANITSDRDSSFSEEPLACPSCGVELTGTNAFETFRVCPGCHRHFPIPARERLRLLVDEESFRETNAALVSLDPLVFRDLLPVPDRLAQAAEPFGGPAGRSARPPARTARRRTPCR